MVSLFFALVTLAIASSAEDLHSLTDAIIDQINSQQDSWTAGRNFLNDTTVEHLMKLNGVILNNRTALRFRDTKLRLKKITLPENFDPRDKWPFCPSLNEIRDQGACLSCWAIAAVEIMTDRHCIRSNGHKHFHYSAEDVLACSREDGCLGGDPAEAWTYFVESGVVSGGNFYSNEGCRPYRLPPVCSEPGKPKYCTELSMPTPACVKKCQEGYKVEYSKDRKFGQSAYRLLNGEINMKTELFLNGPVEASFTIYNDFGYYKEGVYYHTWGNYKSRHAVKILGYGVENGVKYWLAANSWGTNWGDKGFFKIRRGVNECGIEDFIITGQPIV